MNQLMDEPINNSVCSLCGEPVSFIDRCYGCNNLICKSCDLTQPSGDHLLMDHLITPDILLVVDNTRYYG